MNCFWYIVDYVGSVAHAALDLVIFAPLRLFYTAYVWNGAPLEDACAQITKVDARFWLNQTDQCRLMFDRQFSSFSTVIGVSLYFVLLSVLILYLLCRCCFLRPIANEIARAFKKNIKAQQNHVVSLDSRHCGHDHCCRSSTCDQTQPDVHQNREL